MTILGVVGWLLTYALHSTALLAAAFVLARIVRNEAWRDAVWKTALLGAFVTASLPAVPGYTAPAPLWHAGDAGRFEAVTSAQRTATAQNGLERSRAARQDRPSGRAADATGPPGGAKRASGFAIAIVAGWLAIAAALLARLSIVNVRFFRELRARRPVSDDPLAAMLARLRREAGYWRPIRLTESAAATTPLAIGAGEICLPLRYGSDLDAEQQRGGLAHELAHLRRRDPAWRLVTAVIGSIYFFQPLNRIARSRLEETAEHLCDDWAVTLTGSPLGLARCLSEIASWVGRVSAPRESVAIAEGGSPLLTRVRRLADERRSPSASAWWQPLAALLPMALVALFAPVVSGGAAASPAAFSPLPCELVAVDTSRVDAVGVRSLEVRIPAGDVRVNGRQGSEVRIVSRRCASRTELFDALRLDVLRSGEGLDVGFELPSHLFSRTRGSTARIDVTIEAPPELAVRVENAIGSVEVSRVATVHLDDALGDVRITEIAGDLEVRAGPGDVVVADVGGAAFFRVSVGRIAVERVGGNVTIDRDHTGLLEARAVRADLTIGHGQAGDVYIDGLAGDLFVGRIDEGRLHAENVSGRIVTTDEITEEENDA